MPWLYALEIGSRETYMKIEPVKTKKNGPDFKEEVELLRLLIDSGAKLKRLKNDRHETTWIVTWE